MAFDAVTFYRKGGLAFVAGTTTFSTLHLGHANVSIVPDRPEKGIVTVAAGVHPQMFSVTEGQRAEIRDLDGHVSYRMAPGAVIELGCAGIFLVVAGTTRFSLLHVRHGIDGIFLTSYVEDGIMAS